jgi:hypothetical protein
MTTRAAVAVAALLLAAYAVLRAATRPEPYVTLARPAPSSPAPTASPSPPDLRVSLVALDAARADGYADPAAADPDAWVAPSCACRAEDVRRLRALARRGLRLRGHRTTLLGLAVVRAGPDRATLLVTDRLGSYAAVDARGRTVARWPASGPRRWRITLVRTSGRWLLGTVARAP